MRTIALKGMTVVLAALLAGLSASAQERTKTYVIRPVIDSISPERGGPGTKVTLTGRAFSPAYTVWIGSVQLKPVELTESRMVLEIPAGARTGRITLKGDAFAVESRSVFWVAEDTNAPIITSISPTRGAPGTSVHLTGKNFSALIHENQVTLGGKPVVVTDATKDKITVTLPAGVEDGYFQLKVKDGPPATSAQKFMVLAALAIAKIEPEAGPPGGENVVP